jgi:hypothetical protein
VLYHKGKVGEATLNCGPLPPCLEQGQHVMDEVTSTTLLGPTRRKNFTLVVSTFDKLSREVQTAQQKFTLVVTMLDKPLM